MPEAHRTVVIAREVGEVFAFFSDPANDRAWRPHVKQINAEGPLAVGARVQQTIDGPGGRGIPADFEIADYQPGAGFAFRVVAGPVRPEGEFRFTPTADGHTEVTMSLRASLGGIKKLLMAKPVQKSMDGEMAALDRAKELLETS